MIITIINNRIITVSIIIIIVSITTWFEIPRPITPWIVPHSLLIIKLVNTENLSRKLSTQWCAMIKHQILQTCMQGKVLQCPKGIATLIGLGIKLTCLDIFPSRIIVESVGNVISQTHRKIGHEFCSLYQSNVILLITGNLFIITYLAPRAPTCICPLLTQILKQQGISLFFWTLWQVQCCKTRHL